jgi:hypothetical protein
MQAAEGELSSLFLDPVLAGHRVNPQPTLNHQALAHLHPILQILSQIAQAHHLELTRRLVWPEAIEAHGHLGNGHLVVLGVANLGCLQHLHLQQTVIHARTHGMEHPS